MVEPSLDRVRVERMGKGGIMPRGTMPVTISDEVLVAAHISELELKRELALTLFQQERLTLAQASRFSEMSQLAFQALLAERQIPIHYGVEEFRQDLRTLRQVERL
jgi:predicted HTH domain antitoxin